MVAEGKVVGYRRQCRSRTVIVRCRGNLGEFQIKANF